MSEEEKIKELAAGMASLINKNIRDITAAVTVNIDYKKPHTILSSFAALYSVAEYFEYKLTTLGLTPDAIQRAKESADKYVLDVIAGDTNSFSIDKGEA